MADSETPTSSSSESTTTEPEAPVKDGGVFARQAARQAAAQQALDNPPVTETPDPYGPGGTERRRLRADVMISVSGPDVDIDTAKQRAAELLEWIDSDD